MVLPVNIDSTYADDGGDASVAAHQQHHDTIHGALNNLDGGTVGQVPVKASATDFDFSLVTPPWGGGDYFRSGYYAGSGFGDAAAVAASLQLSRLYARPLLVPVRRAFDRIGCNVTTAAAAASGGVLRLGIYANGTGQPGALVLDAGTISSESLGAKEITIAQTLDPGLYWLALVAQVATCSVTGYNSTTYSPWGGGATTPGSATPTLYGYMAPVTGSLPAWTESGTTAVQPMTQLRAV